MECRVAPVVIAFTIPDVSTQIMKVSSNSRNLKQASFHLPGPLVVALFAALVGSEATATPIASSELVAPKFDIVDGTLNFTVQPSVAGRSYQLQYSDTLEGGTWLDLGEVVSGDGNNLVMTTPYTAGVAGRFYRLALDGVSSAPNGFALIPAGSFPMGDQSNPLVGRTTELPVHSVNVSMFYMGKYEVTKELWDEVRTWGASNGYTDLPGGNASRTSKGANHPVHSIDWYGVVKWCNARSEKESLSPCYTVTGAIYKMGQNDTVVWNSAADGYRLPTEAEWEKAARGGVSGKNFPWGTDTITHSQANYYSSSSYAYDISPTRNFHPTYGVGAFPLTAPADSFTPNGYGLFNMSGNVWEWCWDWYGPYTADAQTDPRGLANGTGRVMRSGSCLYEARSARCASRTFSSPSKTYDSDYGFRVARSHP